MLNLKSQISNLKNNEGQLLLEILIVIGVVAIIAGLSGQMVIVSMKSSKSASEKGTAVGLAQEALEAVKNISSERWQNVYGLNKGSSNHYHLEKSSGKWILASGDEVISLNNINYARYLVVDNASRDSDTRDIDPVYDSLNDDPSTQKITVSVEWGGGEIVSFSEYATRWRNKVCYQSDWSGGISGGPANCPATTYANENGDVDFSTAGTLKIKPQ